MANQLEVPAIIGLHYVPLNPDQDPAYETRWDEDYIFEDTIYDWQEHIHRFQPVKIGDKIPLQMTANFAPLLHYLEDCAGNQYLTANFSPIRANKYAPGSFLYELTIDTLSLPEGLYRSILVPASDIQDALKSEWMHVAAVQPNTVRIDYYNIRYHADIVFETGIKLSFRVRGSFEDKAPGSIDVLYADQILNQTQLSSRTFTNKTFYLGDGGGEPIWVPEKMNQAFSCSHVLFDGKLLSKADGAKWNEFAQENTRVKGWSIDVRPGINRTSRIVNPTIDPTKKLTFVAYIDGSVFGSIDNSGGNIVTPIINVQ